MWSLLCPSLPLFPVMSNNLGVAQLDALVSLVISSVNDFKAEYHSASIPVPVLREPSSEGHDEMRKRLESKKLTKVAQIIEAACAQLSAIVVRPELTLANVCTISFILVYTNKTTIALGLRKG